MKVFSRVISLVLLFSLLLSSAAAASKKDTKPVARQITTEVVQEIPEAIQHVLDLAYQQWVETDAAELKKKNKFTKWRNNYEYGWCGGFITWCMLEANIPNEVNNKIKRHEVSGLFHVKEAGVGKLYSGYEKLNRITRIPQKGFIAVFGSTKTPSTPYFHVGLVYDVEKLDEGLYRLTTIEGNVSSPGDDSHGKSTHSVRMYTRDYHLNAEEKKKDLTLVPQDQRSREEDALFSYDYTYGNKSLYVTIFLMPWIPDEQAED